MIKKKIEKGFTANSCNFQGVAGYIVEQWHEGRVICSQFVASSVYNEFCKKLGVIPLLND